MFRGILQIFAACALMSADMACAFVVSTQSSRQLSALGVLGDGMSAADGATYNSPIRIEGDTMKTWKILDDSLKYHIRLQTNGRPGNCDINLWHGPDYSPTNIKVFLEDGAQYPLSLVLTPKGHGLDTIQVLNTGPQEFPLISVVGPASPEVGGIFEDLVGKAEPQLIQGGDAVRSYNFDPSVDKVQVAMQATDGRNVKVQIELLQGPNNIKQTVEFYASNAYKTPFYLIMDTPGGGHQIRIRNKYPVEFPLAAYVEPLMPVGGLAVGGNGGPLL